MLSLAPTDLCGGCNGGTGDICGPFGARVATSAAAIAIGLTLIPASQFRVNFTNLPMVFSKLNLEVEFRFIAIHLHCHLIL